MMKRRLIMQVGSSEGERGAIAVITAILLIAMFTLVALVIDIAALRADARTGQTTGDFAAVAGGLSIDPTTGGTPLQGCIAAYQYFVANTPGLPSAPSPVAACAVFASNAACDPLTAVSAEIDVGPYHLTITTPIPDDHPLMQGRLNTEIDGDPCLRIAVQVRRTRAYLFGGLVNSLQGQSEPPAVARGAAGGEPTVAVALLLLDPTGCKTLYTSGQGSVWVKPVPSANAPGIITSDSNATHRGIGDRDCRPGQDYSIDAVGTINSKILAGGLSFTQCDPVSDGLIFSFALMPGQPRPDASFEDRDVTLCGPNYGVAPRPLAGPRITRSPMDYRYNCKSSYPPYFGITIKECPDTGDDPGQPFIDKLTQAVGTGTGNPPPGFLPAVGAGRPIPNCSPNSPIVVPPGNWYVSCTTNSAGQGLSLSNKLVFTSPSNVVFEGGVNVNSGAGRLCMNVVDIVNCSDPAGPGPDGYVYFRQGDRSSTAHFVKDAQGSIVLMRTMVYQESGRVDFAAGSGSLTWVAPYGGNFEDLALWSERVTDYLLGGQAALNLEGTFFTPFANPFTFSGQPGLNQTKAQFFTYRLQVGGLGTLVMAPDPERITLVPIAGVLLIR